MVVTCSLWFSGGVTIAGASSANLVGYTNDMKAGQSGAPVYRNRPDCTPCVIAINSYEDTPQASTNPNHGVRINQDVYNYLAATAIIDYSAPVPLIKR